MSAVVTVPNGSAFNTTALTVSAWVQTTSTSNPITIMDRDNFNSEREFQFRIYNNDLDFIPFLGTTPTPYPVSGSTAINDGNFHYVVGTYDGNNIDVYVDGALSTTLAQSGTLSSASTLTLLFGQSNTNEYYFNGILDELRFSSIARNASWIAAEYANQNNQNNSVFLTVGPQQ
jgi:hypothetical protein